MSETNNAQPGPVVTNSNSGLQSTDTAQHFQRVGELGANVERDRDYNEAQTSLLAEADDIMFDSSFRDYLGAPSLSSFFKVKLDLGNTGTDANGLENWLSNSGIYSSDGLGIERFSLLASEAILPGTNMAVITEQGSRQGIVEKFAAQRTYNDIALTYYVTGDYKTLRLFQEWINFMNPLYTASSSIEEKSAAETPKPFGYPKSIGKNQFQRLRYPDEYKRSLSITKFERNIGNTGSIKTYRGTQIPEVDPVFTPEKSFVPDAISYQFINAFPTSIQDIALTYQASTVLQVTVEFAYDRYVIVQNARKTGYEKASVPAKDDTKITVSDEVDKS